METLLKSSFGYLISYIKLKTYRDTHNISPHSTLALFQERFKQPANTNKK